MRRRLKLPPQLVLHPDLMTEATPSTICHNGRRILERLAGLPWTHRQCNEQLAYIH
eukprot:m.578981 g.578981  ORF g.578981 m.578981 type:complete len:56 (+) comp57922_c1_seq1:548-715(+)